MQKPVSSPSIKLLVEKFLKAAQNKAESDEFSNADDLYNGSLLENIEDFPKILNEVINQLQQEKIHISKARLIAATACQVLEVYTLNHLYKKGEDDNIKQVIKLLGFLILGAVKTPINRNNSSNNPLETGLSSSSSISPQNSIKSNLNLQGINEEKQSNYSLIALRVFNNLFDQKGLDSELILMISSFYCVDCRELPSQGFSRLKKILTSLNFQEYSPEYSRSILLFEKLGFREVMGLAEFQYRKQNYIQLKSKLNNPSISDQDSCSPLEFLKENLLDLYQKLKLQEATTSMMFVSDSSLQVRKLDVDSDSMDYWNYPKLKVGIYEKSLLIFRALMNLCCEGMFWNVRVKNDAQKSLGFRAKSQDIFTSIHKNWMQELSNIVRLNIVGKIFTNPQGHQFRKTILDWPLNSFFPEVNLEPSKITQSVIKQKIENLPLLDATNFLILLYSNIQENPNPLGQVVSLYAALNDYLSFNKNYLEWTKDYLDQQGFTSVDISKMLHLKEE